ncbi:MAG: glycosyltransferase [Pseudomonadota bacterium]
MRARVPRLRELRAADRPVLELLTFSTLFPNRAQPRHGLFVEGRLRELRTRHPVAASVIAPVPWFPFRHPRFGKYARFAQVPSGENRDGVSIRHPRYVLPPKVGMHIAPRAMALGAASAVRQTVEHASYTPVLDAHYFYPDGVAAAHLARRFGLPLVITARGSDVNLLPEFPAVRRRMLAAGQQAAALVAVSEALARRMVDIGLPADKIHVLQNGVDLDTFRVMDRDAARASLGLSGPVILSVGNLLELKGHHLTIEALKQHPGATLIIAGEGPESARLARLASELNVASRVRFVGSVAHAELVQYYNCADLTVLASSREGMANVLLETLACGTPAVVTPVGGNPEVISHPDAGVVVHERSADALAAGVARVLAAPPPRAATRQQAERFAWGAVTGKLYALLEGIASSSSAGTGRHSNDSNSIDGKI